MPLSQKLCFFRGSLFPQCFIQLTALHWSLPTNHLCHHFLSNYQQCPVLLRTKRFKCEYHFKIYILFYCCPYSAPKPQFAKLYHDWRINTLQRSPFYKDLILTVGGWNFTLWKEGVEVKKCSPPKKFCVCCHILIC